MKIRIVSMDTNWCLPFGRWILHLREGGKWSECYSSCQFVNVYYLTLCNSCYCYWMNCLELSRNEIEWNYYWISICINMWYHKICFYIVEPSCSLVLLMALQARLPMSVQQLSQRQRRSLRFLQADWSSGTDGILFDMDVRVRRKQELFLGIHF